MATRDRKLPEINAGSMADIAFLLLVFFLVTTTINEPEEGIPQTLPPVQPPPPPHNFTALDWNVLKLRANNNNKLLVEQDFELSEEELHEVYTMTRKFYGSHEKSEVINEDGDEFPDYPIRELTTSKTIQYTMDSIQQMMRSYEAIGSDTRFFRVMLKKEKDKLYAWQQLGDYYALPNISMIQFKSGKETTYGFYIKVMDQMKSAVRDLQNEFCMKQWNRSYDELVQDPDLHSDKIEIVEVLYPMKKIIDSSSRMYTGSPI